MCTLFILSAQLSFRYLKPGEPNQKPVSPLQAPAEPVSDSEYRTPPPGDPESPHGKQSSDSDSDKSKVPSVKSFVFLAETNGPEYPSTTSSGIQSYLSDNHLVVYSMSHVATNYTGSMAITTLMPYCMVDLLFYIWHGLWRSYT